MDQKVLIGYRGKALKRYMKALSKTWQKRHPMEPEAVLEIRNSIHDLFEKSKVTQEEAVGILCLCIIEFFQRHGVPYEQFKAYVNNRFDSCEEDWPVG